MRHIRIKRNANPLVVNYAGDYPTIDELLEETYEREDAKNNSNNSSDNSSGSGKNIDDYVKTADGITDVLVKLFDNIVSPIFNFGGKGTGQVNIVKEKDNTLTYLLIGVVIVVIIILLMRFAKK